MVIITKNVDNRWMKRYKTFFLLGILFITLQLFLAYKFVGLNYETTTNAWSPHKNSKSDINDAENSVNSARKARDSLVDDEDVRYTKPIKKTTERHATNKTNLRLRLEELDFVPDCDITTREAISAIHRARTQECKQEIATVTCLILKGEFYPKDLPNYCDNGGRKFAPLGCYKDEKTFRILSGYSMKLPKNSPESCKYLCLQIGYVFAGVEYGNECFCGNTEPPASAKLPDSSCNMKCPGDPHLTCGGHFAINVYQTGIKEFSAKEANTPNNGTSRSVRIVFLLTLNGRALRQVRRLLKNLYHKDHYYYIHVDIRQDYLFRELLPLETRFTNIRLTRQRFATIWGGASLLKMLLSTMKELTEEHADWNWDFVINLSESDYPVKTLPRLVDFLSANRDSNFVKSHGREAQRFIQKQGLDKTFLECDTHMWRIGDRKLPGNVQIDGGSDWIALSRKFVGYVVNFHQDELLEGLILVFKYTLLPAESFFHTVLRNSRFCETYVDNNLHVTNWKRKLGCKCQYKHIVDWCGCSPNDFKPEDWLRIAHTESKQLFFARKFEPIVNQAVIRLVEEWLYGKNFSFVINIDAYWQSLYTHKDNNQIDDALTTIVQSIIRITSKNKCSEIVLKKILEITSHHKNDSYRQTLVYFELANISTNFEIGFRPKSFVKHLSNIVTKRLKFFYVSSDYDLKELISRNFARVLGPYSEPSLVYEFKSDIDSGIKTLNVTFLWTDPVGRSVEVNTITIDDGPIYGHIKPTFKQPLLPGIWTVILIYQNDEVARSHFLVTPLSYYAGRKIGKDQVKFVNSGSGVIKDIDGKYDKFTLDNMEQERLERLAASNSKRFGKDLDEWVDSLVGKVYSIADHCAEVEATLCGKIIGRCNQTNWSSLAPDPKSALGEVNKTTGMFNLF